MSRDENDFKRALDGKQIPILTLDNKWHQIFVGLDTTGRIIRLRDELTKLLMEQGKCNTEGKDIRKLKTKLMNEVVVFVDQNEAKPSKKGEKKIAETRRLIDECNDKLDEYREKLMELPKEIDKVNSELMLATMEVCYKAIKDNSQQIEEIGEWITQIRRELKKKVIRKQEKERGNQLLYSYMHDIFGAEVIEIFDMKYQPQLPERKAKTDNEDSI